MNIKAFIQRHPIATYFGMTFIISWIGAFLVVAPKLLHGEAIPQIDGLLMFPVLLIGPSFTGITLTAVLDGRSGLRHLFAQMGHWNVDARWYAAAVLIPFALILVTLFSLSALNSPVFTPHLFPLGFLFGLVPGFLEEIGWMGFAFPKMRLKFGAFSASLLLGVIWGLWHLPVIDFLGAASPHGAYWLPFALAFIAAMTAMRVLIVWIYSNTKSLFLAQLMHVSSTAFLVVLGPTPISPAHEALWYAIYATVLWLVISLVVMRYGKSFVRQSMQVEKMQTAIK